MKKLINLLKVSTILTAFCGLLSVGCLLNGHTKKAESVSASGSVVNIELQNVNGALWSYTFSGSFNYNGSTPSIDTYWINGSYSCKVYYTGVNDNISLDFSLNSTRIATYEGFANILNANPYTTSVAIGYGALPTRYYFSFGALGRITDRQVYVPISVYFSTSNGAPFYTLSFNYTLHLDRDFTVDVIDSVNTNYYESNNFTDTLSQLVTVIRDTYSEAYQEALDSNSQSIYDSGYQDGYSSGWQIGINQAHETDKQQIDQAYQSGYDYALSISEEFYASASQTSHDNGYREGYAVGYDDGVDSQESVIEEASQTSYGIGYVDGYEQGHSEDQTVSTIFSGILQVALVPINFFLACFNFEILGINLSGFIRALFTIAITVIIIRTIFGGKGASDS